MNDRSNRNSEFFQEETGEIGNLLWQYVQSMSPDTVSQLSKPNSSEVFQVMDRTIGQFTLRTFWDYSNNQS